jgi:hypothetical protein
MNNELLNLLSKYNIEAVPGDNNTVMLYCPKIPDESVKTEINQHLHQAHEYIEGLKQKTKRQLRAILSQSGAINGKVMIKDRTIDIEALESVNEIDWNQVCQILIDDGYPTYWTLTTNSGVQEFKVNYCQQLFETRSNKRTKPISDDDVQNLIIDLNNIDNIDDFINQM